MRYVAIIDFKAETGKMFECKILSDDLILAMTEAEGMMDDSVYLVKIAEKVTKTERKNKCRIAKYAEIVVNRGHGWNICDSAHGESSNLWEVYEKDGKVESFEAILR